MADVQNGYGRLPEDPDQLAERLELGRDSFSGKLAPQDCWYTLMLDHTGTLSSRG